MAVAVVGGSLTAAERPAKAVTQAGGVVPMTLILSALVLCAVGVMPEAHAKTPGEVDIGETVPEATLQGLNGPSRKLSEFHGKPLIINVWASWCGPCRKEMASLERLAWLKRARHFNIIGVSTDDDPAQAKTWLKQSNATITQFIDTGLQMENMLGASRLPLTVLVDADGRVVDKMYGAREWDSPESLELIRKAFRTRPHTSLCLHTGGFDRRRSSQTRAQTAYGARISVPSCCGSSGPARCEVRRRWVMAKDLASLQILTPRLLLRPLQMPDFEAWAAFTADPEASRFLGGPQPRPLAWRSFMTTAGAWHLQGFSMFSVIERSSQRWVGRLGPWMPDGWPGTEVGWGIIRDCWGRGYAVEGATAAIDWAFDELGWREVIHAIDSENGASQAVARKLGSELIGPGRLPAPIDTAVEIWGQSRAAWRARRAALSTVKDA